MTTHEPILWRAALAAALLALTGGCAMVRTTRTTRYTSHGVVASWMLLGEGTVEPAGAGTGEAVSLAVETGSRGAILLAPPVCGPDVVFAFRFKASGKGTLHAILNASNAAGGAGLPVPRDYDGGLGWWTASDSPIRSSIFTLPAGGDARRARLRRHPGGRHLAEGPAAPLEAGWHDVEVGRAGGRLWMTLDERTVLEVRDEAPPPPPGHVGLQIEGDGPFACLLRDLTLVYQPAD
jgi:hypothetical protein